MNRDEALKKSEEALTELATALKAGKSDALVRYLDMISLFHQYSFCNCLLIAMQMPIATFVAGFHRWKQLGRFVKKGEKGIAILAPMVGKRRKKDEVPSTDSEQSGVPVVFGFRTVFVFDVTQTDGAELPEFSAIAGDPCELQSKVVDLITETGIGFEYVDQLGGANGASYDGRIAVVDSLPPAQKFSTSVHELAHELLHRGERCDSTTKTVRETEAEAVAYAVCRWAGLECSTRAADYIQLYAGDEKLLLQSLELIRDVAAKVITALSLDSEKQVEPSSEVAHAC